ncbi:hypothetical protein AK830_g8352 [Neonectria ditissima]|uniref:Zn(2)-C6 fungal-type domain-containing protein n=1 Tax=Neonectria ditissima TaxID=78410 RepID=A0A0P7BEE2_9HYPO|nr:hypothetical protein AK830_g8352 [Neonectria ditissima]
MTPPAPDNLNPSPPQPPRKRAKHTRSRLGCGVCRIRRVRCDRARPSCERCTTTGRKCDGYSLAAEDDSSANAEDPDTLQLILRSAPHVVQTIPSELTTNISLGPQAGRSFYYFQHNTALEFSGYFDSDLWSSLVLQISRRETCVRQMVVALGLLHESFHHDHAGSDCNSPSQALRKQAINEYTEAIRLLNLHISTHGWASLEITLLCSILCVAFEWLRGDYATARTHLLSSISIMSQWKDKSIQHGTSLSSPSGHMIRTRLRPVCTTLVLQARSMSNSVVLPWDLALDLQQGIQPFENLQQARNSLDLILADILPETVTEEGPGREIDGKVWERARQLTKWSQYFNTYLSENGLEESSSAPLTIMNLWHKTAYMLLITSIKDDEMAYDDFFLDFTDIVERTESLLSSSSTKFSVDIGVVPLLYYVALKCRHPQIRRKAIGMLTSTPRREAVWDSLGAACVLQEVVHVEEKGLGEVHTHADIPSSVRVCNMNVILDVESRRMQIRIMQQGPMIWGDAKVLTW